MWLILGKYFPILETETEGVASSWLIVEKCDKFHLSVRYSVTLCYIMRTWHTFVGWIFTKYYYYYCMEREKFWSTYCTYVDEYITTIMYY